MTQSLFRSYRLTGFCLFALILLLGSCKQDIIVVEDNDAPYYDEIPTIKIENYVNKIYIDLIGREPLPDEMTAEVALLKDNDLSFATRKEICLRLQTDTIVRNSDSSYKYAYYHRFYELQKARTLESASNEYIEGQVGIARNAAYVDSLSGDMVSYEKNTAQADLMEAILLSEEELLQGLIGIDEMLARMLNNPIYDQINMNSFNFINACFDDLFAREPSENEYNQAYQMVEFNNAGLLFQTSGQNKKEFIDILVRVAEFYEGFIRWTYKTLTARDATTQEVSDLMQDFWADHDITRVQREVLSTDEYANF